MTPDKTMVDLLASYTGTVTRCPPGRASAPTVKERGQAQFQCACGHAGTMPYPTLFKRLRWGRRRRKPLRLRCQRCGRVLH
jgi:lysyl-tRNA synthetase class I